MTEQEALARMIAPATPRPHIWRRGIMQVHVTRACDKQCFGCTQGSNLGGKPVMIAVEEFDRALQSLRGYWGVVGVFGGNPTIHPRFEELCAVLRRHFPREQCGLWSNKLLGKGAAARRTFNPAVSNLNVHQDREAFDEFWRDWPEARRVVKGLDTDSRHSPPYVAMLDQAQLTFPDGSKRPNTEENRLDLIGNCDINQNWSAMVCQVPGKGLRGFFCEIAGAMAMLHAHDDDWPDTGLRVYDDVQGRPVVYDADGAEIPDPQDSAYRLWWQLPMAAYAAQVRHNCHRCGVPLRRFGQLANGGEFEEVSATHAAIYKPKDRGRRVELVTVESGPPRTLPRATDYIQNGSLK